MVTTSFQKTGMVILHILRDLAPDLPVYFLDTGFHFRETLEFAESIRRRWGIRLVLNRPRLFGDAFVEQHGRLYETNPDQCCELNKVEPQRDLLLRYQGWIAGVRRDQTSARGEAEILELVAGDTLKVNPLAHWTRGEVDYYIATHRIPVHPLFARGYSSIGCAPCTRPSSDSRDERAGRWAGTGKTECGLHTRFTKSEPVVSILGSQSDAATP